jgi:hypothetical protein
MKKITSITISIFLLISSKAYAQTDRSEHCSEQYKVTEIPRLIRKEIKQHYKSRFVMANPKEKYQATDVVDGRMLRERRLIFWALCGDDFYLVYEHGGHGYHKHVILFRRLNGKYHIVKNIGPGKSTTLDEIKEVSMEDDRSMLDHF